MEQQQDLFNKTPNESKWKTKQARVTPDEDQDITLTCKWVGLPFSVIVRIFFRILLRRRQEMSQIKDDPVKMIGQASEEFLTYIPIYTKQRQIAPRLF